jgi:hypothetical protein
MTAFRIPRCWRVTALAVGVALASGCYSYLPVTAAPKAGQRVRIALTPEGSVELTRFLGPGVAEAEGQLSSVSADGSMVVAVDFVRMSNGVRQPWSGEGVVSIPSTYVAHMRERTYLRRQSMVAGAGLTVALVATAIVALRSGGIGGGGGGPPPPPP